MILSHELKKEIRIKENKGIPFLIIFTNPSARAGYDTRSMILSGV